jgi:hypothetical protein
MKYTIMGFSQKKAIEYNLDLTDLTILRWFVDFRGTSKMIEEIYNNRAYYWVDYKNLLKDIPIIGIISKIVLRRRLKKMVDKGILIHFTKKKDGVYSFYNLGKNYNDFVSFDNTKEEDPYKLKSLNHKTQKFKPINSKVYTKDSSIKDSSIKNNNIVKNSSNEESKKSQKIKAVIRGIEKKLNSKVNIKVLEKTIKKNRLKVDDIEYYVDNWDKFDYKNKSNKIGFLLTLAIQKAELPNSHKGFNKPDQSLNFTQRQYDDEFFNSLENEYLL